VCPWRTRLRELASLLSLREVDGAGDGRRVRAGIRGAACPEELPAPPHGPAAVPFLLQSPWHVPIRWFVLVTDEERRLVEDGEFGTG
jgi:hypothetical protein